MRQRVRYSINGFKVKMFPNGIALLEKSLPKVRNEDDTLNAVYYATLEKAVRRLMRVTEQNHIVYVEVSRLEVYVPSSDDLNAITNAINEVIDGIPFTTDKRDRSKSSEYRRTYYERNKEEKKERQKKYYAEHKAERQEYRRNYYHNVQKKSNNNLGL